MLVLCLSVASAALCLSGCGQGGQLGGSAWDDSADVAVLEPFQGKWRFDQERTLAQWEAQGMSKEEIAGVREMYQRLAEAELPAEAEKALRAAGVDPSQLAESMGRMHPDLTFEGHVAVCDGFPTGEYRLFAIHEHDQQVCAKAWHHEDRFDPGDMSKCYVRLAVEGDELHLQLRMQDGGPDLDDPDLRGKLPILAASASACDADAPAGEDWSEWTTYVFVRPSDG
jgi:hypothetical protein